MFPVSGNVGDESVESGVLANMDIAVGISILAILELETCLGQFDPLKLAKMSKKLRHRRVKKSSQVL